MRREGAYISCKGRALYSSEGNGGGGHLNMVSKRKANLYLGGKRDKMGGGGG